MTNMTKIDFEYGIHRIWGIKDHLDTLLWRYMDHPEIMSEDEIANQLLAISCTLDLYCSKLFDDYKKYFELDEYASPEAIARREELLSQLFKDVDAKSKKKSKK